MATGSYPVPANETERLHDLRELGLAGEGTSGQARGLSEIPALAAEVCDRPWAGVSVVEKDQHRFLTVQGPFSTTVPREWAPCAHAICHTGEVFEIEDLREEEPFEGNPLVDTLGVRFYAGAPIESQRGHGLGTVCVLDEQPGQLDPGQRDALAALSTIVSLHVRLHRRTEQLEQANEALDRFATFVSHELTNPISQVVGNLELLRMDLGDLEEEAEEALSQAIQGATRMDRMVGDLLRYARASGRPLEKETVDLASIIDQTRASVRPPTRDIEAEIEVEMETDTLPRVHADEQLLQRVLHNLVENAIAHGGQPAHVHVGCEDAGDAWRLWVADEGEGVPPDDQERIFDLFEKGQHGEKEAPGQTGGVGLALCKDIVERHGGQIGVDATPGEGSTVWFTLPKAPG